MSPPTPSTRFKPVVDPTPTTIVDEDYGFEHEHDHLLARLLDDIQARRVRDAPANHSLQSGPLSAEDLQELSSQDPNTDIVVASILDETFTAPRNNPPVQDETQPPANVDQSDQAPDTRTPLERFRTAPKKPLSVTDLISPAWCELQYWYSLIKFGRVRKTPAMQRGSSVHKELEDQVHVTVRIEVQTREDHWGLRIWNIIQSLRTLRATGLTRELELWATVDGQVVNGVVDELSYTCPDPALEARLEQSESGAKKVDQLPPDQTTLSAYFSSQGLDDVFKGGAQARSDQKIYITDVKTRGAASTPKGASLRPTLMQLMLYRTMLVSLATDRVDSTTVFERYRLDPDLAFSDSLIRQLSTLELPASDSDKAEEAASLKADVDTVAELLGHNSLNQLWRLMIQEFKNTVPLGDNGISRVLTAEFRHRDDGRVVGIRTFAYDEEGLHDYVGEEMRWWRGEREAKGVDVEEAFKCRICEFAENCSWRKNKIGEDVQKSRLRRWSSQTSPAAKPD